MKRIIIFSIVIFCISTTYAQPGYLGKKTDISIGTSAMLSFGAPTYSSNSFAAMDLKPSIDIERVLSRKSSLSIGFQRYRTSVSSSFQDVNGYYIYGDPDPSKYDDNFDQVSKLKAYSNMFSVMLNNYYKTPGVAFFGGYWNFG